MDPLRGLSICWSSWALFDKSILAHLGHHLWYLDLYPRNSCFAHLDVPIASFERDWRSFLASFFIITVKFICTQKRKKHATTDLLTYNAMPYLIIARSSAIPDYCKVICNTISFLPFKKKIPLASFRLW